MSNPLDTNSFTFELNFINEDSFGLIQITEPVGFDALSFIVEQDNERYGRDVFKINESINITFYKGTFENTPIAQSLPNGIIINNLTQGFEYLIETKRIYGFESEVEFIIKKGGVQFAKGVLDFQTSETDGITYFSCSVVQNTQKQLFKRRGDVVTDVFSDTDLDGNAIEPVDTTNILLRAKPVRQISGWEFTDFSFNIISFGFQQFVGFPLFNNLVNFGIDRSLAPFDTAYSAQLVNEPAFLEGYREDISILKAQTDLSNVKVRINNLSFSSAGDDPVNVRRVLTVAWGSSYVTGEYDFVELIDVTQLGTFAIDNQNYEVDIPFIPNGGFLFIDFSMLGLFPSGGVTPVGSFGFTMQGGTLDITATSTAIDSVIKGVRYIDVIKANVARSNGFTVNAPRYNVGGEYYDQFAFTGNLIKQRDDVPFPVKTNDLMKDLKELNGDFQVLDNSVFIGHYSDFYANKEIGAFLTFPDESFKTTFNERYAINQFELNYKNFEQDRDESNTVDAIHTESQWMTANKQVENTKKVEIDYIRDAYNIEATRKLGLKETTSTSDDDKMFLIDVVPLAPTTRGGFTSVLNHNVDANDNLQLLRTELFRWDLLGFGVGSEFIIVSGENVGTYIVLELDESLVRLEPQGFTPTFSGETFTEVSYTFSNVLLTNRTDEGLIFFDNLINGDDYSNLRYSIKRNIITWHPYLATASIYKPNDVLRNTYFRNNGECITQFEGEPLPIKENENINNVDLGAPILTPLQHETLLVAPYPDVVNTLIALDTVNPDNTIAGFIRCVDANGKVVKLYPKAFEYEPATETLTLTGEERFEGENVVITLNSQGITVNSVLYPFSLLRDVWYEITDDYLLIYDSNYMPVINATRFDKVTVNGQTFVSAIDLMNYLVNNT